MSEVKSESAKKNEDWMNAKWRPAMGWMYMAVCMADFVIFPILWSLVQTLGDGRVETQWMPITLQGAGLFHMAMGAILGIAAYGRTQEKMAGANNGGISTPAPMTPVSQSVTTSYAAPAAPAFKPAPAPDFASAPAFGKAPVQPAHPEI